MSAESELRARIGPDAYRVAALALEEDGARDVTSEVVIPPDLTATGTLEFRTAGILAGTAYADAVAKEAGLQPVTWHHAAGTPIPAGAAAGVLRGNLRRILRAERPLLNLLQRAAGIATLTRAYVDAISGTPARIVHTRKTAPGLRLLDVSAVLAGGGHLHRLDLAAVLMVKDNHWRVLERGGQSLAGALRAVREQGVTDRHVEVETPAQVEEACAAGATRLLVDNQPPETVRSWGNRARAIAPGIQIEATGGITLQNVRAYAEAGADFISVGALTHSVRAADVGLEVSSEE